MMIKGVILINYFLGVTHIWNSSFPNISTFQTILSPNFSFRSSTTGLGTVVLVESPEPPDLLTLLSNFNIIHSLLIFLIHIFGYIPI